MPFAALTLGLLLALALGCPFQETSTAEGPFPSSTALAEGVSPEALTELSQLIQGLVDDEEIVGAELLVIKNGRAILHEAFGWSDLEAKKPMQTGSVFCVRSMTKPVIGTAILMLIDDDLLELETRVAQHLPSFDVDGSRDITVEHLLTHTSGLPMSLILGKDLKELDGIQAVAALGGGYELDFEAGRNFNYSDQGTDTLTALIEVVSGMPAAQFVRTRILDPLGMQDSACVMTEDHPARTRAIPAYAGSRGEWSRFWSPDEPELFPFFLGSQGLYSTLEDYGRFMDFWRRNGHSGKERLLRARYARKALTLGPHPMGYPTGMPGVLVDYGYQMQLWTRPVAEEGDGQSLETQERELVAFGHGGSDGTHAWVFPEQKGMVLYFTQSRNNTTGLRVEEALGELFLGLPFDPNATAPPFEQYLGYYWENEVDDLYRAIILDGEDLALEIMGQGIVPLSYVGEDRWKFRSNPSTVIAFDRSEAGEVTGFHIGDHQEFRFEPSAELPSTLELAARVADAHRIDLLESLGPLRMTGELNIAKLDLSGEFSTVYAWPDLYRSDNVVGEEFDRSAFDGEQLWYASKARPVAVLEGSQAELMRLDNPFARFGDWSRWHPSMHTIQRLERGGREVFLVRTGDTSAPARTYYVDGESGRVLREDGLTHVDNMGRIGQRVTFGDFRDVSGMTLPFRAETQLANPLIGSIATTVRDFELGVELPEGTFELND